MTMTRFVHIDPKARTITAIDAKDPHSAVPSLTLGNVDHGVVTPGIGIIVYEWGLREGDGPYFALGGQLYAGDAVLYGYDEAGETIDMPADIAAPLLWLADKSAVESAIRFGLVDRPQVSVNGVVEWRWNAPV